jgi:DNA polymerase elongation subunit (family B)
MYLNIFYQRPEEEDNSYSPGFIHLWDDSGYRKIPYTRHAFKLDPQGDCKTLYGQPCKKVKRWSKEDEQAGKIFESDISPEMRYLVDTYSEFDTPSDSHTELFFDIEVDSSNGLPYFREPINSITAISYYEKKSKTYTALILDTSGEIENTEYSEMSGDNIKIVSFGSEDSLLDYFMEEYTRINPTILTGWNIDNFDIPYLYNRMRAVFDDDYARKLSPIGIVKWNEYRQRYFIAGVSCLDYMALYKNKTLSPGERVSYSLDSIGKLEVGMGKIKYDGTLDKLFREDKQKFIEYNIHDVRIVVKIDEKKKFIDLAKSVCHKGHVPYEDILFPSRYLDGAILTYMKNKGLVAPNKPNKGYDYDNDDDEKFDGAYVKDPIPGKYKWVVDLDAQSLYPSIIMTLNISPETKVSKVSGWNVHDFISKKDSNKIYEVDLSEKLLKMDHDKMQKFLDESGLSISSNGVLYEQKTLGIIPEILNKWFEERVEYKDLMKKYGKEKNKEKYEYYHMRQYTQKIILNSLYGVLGLPTFRYYDIDNAEAVTTTGVDLIQFAQKIINLFFFKELAVDKDYIIYVDTDSCFFSVEPIVDKRFPGTDKTDILTMGNHILSITKDIQNFVNNSMNYFSKNFSNLTDHRFYFKQELIAKSAFWAIKKRYALLITNKEGIPADEMEIKGLDAVRTNFPKVFRDFMKGIIRDILDDVEKEKIDEKIVNLKKSLSSMNLSDIARPTSVKNITQYTDGRNSAFDPIGKGAAVHVKAAIHYNDFIEYHKLHKNYAKIMNGEKIKWVYLKQNPFKITELAYKDNGEDPKEILDYLSEYVDYEKIFESELVKKIKDFYVALSWGNIPTKINVNASKFF